MHTDAGPVEELVFLVVGHGGGEIGACEQSERLHEETQ